MLRQYSRSYKYPFYHAKKQANLIYNIKENRKIIARKTKINETSKKTGENEKSSIWTQTHIHKYMHTHKSISINFSLKSEFLPINMADSLLSSNKDARLLVV